MMMQYNDEDKRKNVTATPADDCYRARRHS